MAHGKSGAGCWNTLAKTTAASQSVKAAVGVCAVRGSNPRSPYRFSSADRLLRAFTDRAGSGRFPSRCGGLASGFRLREHAFFSAIGAGMRSTGGWVRSPPGGSCSIVAIAQAKGGRGMLDGSYMGLAARVHQQEGRWAGAGADPGQLALDRHGRAKPWLTKQGGVGPRPLRRLQAPPAHGDAARSRTDR